MAPEIVTETAYDYSIDIWSLGVLLYEMLHGHAPFKGKEYKEIASNIKKGEIKYSSSIAQDAEELIASILVKEPSKRPSINTILSSSFVTRNHSIMNFLSKLYYCEYRRIKYIKIIRIHFTEDKFTS